MSGLTLLPGLPIDCPVQGFGAKLPLPTLCALLNSLPLQVPLEDESVDVAVFCLSLMGTNIRDFLEEANRVLKPG